MIGRLVAADGPAEHRVVPVHRELRLVQEQVAVLAQRVSQPAARQLPLGLGVVHQLGERDPRPQRLVDAGRRRQQRVLVHRRGPAVAPTPAPRRCRRTAAASRRPSRAPGARPASTAPRTPGRGVPASGATAPPPGRPTCWSRRWRPRPSRRRTSSARSRRRAGGRGPTRRRAGPHGPPPRRSAPSPTRGGSRRRCGRRGSTGSAPSGSCMRHDRARGRGQLPSRQHSRQPVSPVVSTACGSRGPGSCRSPGRGCARPLAWRGAAS